MHCVVAVMGYMGAEHLFFYSEQVFLTLHLGSFKRHAKPETKLVLVRPSWQSSIVFGKLKVHFR